MINKIRRTYEALTASYDYRTVSKLVCNTSRAFTLEYCAKTVVYGAILEQKVRFRPIYDSLRRSVMIDLWVVSILYSRLIYRKLIIDFLLTQPVKSKRVFFIIKMNYSLDIAQSNFVHCYYDQNYQLNDDDTYNR